MRFQGWGGTRVGSAHAKTPPRPGPYRGIEHRNTIERAHVLRRARERQHELRRRKRDGLVGRLVVVEIVLPRISSRHRASARSAVFVGRPEVVAVDWHDLRPGDALQDRLVIAAEHDLRTIEGRRIRQRRGGNQEAP